MPSYHSSNFDTKKKLINIFLINIIVLFLHYYKFLNYFRTSSHLILLIYKKLALHTYFCSHSTVSYYLCFFVFYHLCFAFFFVLAISFILFFFSKLFLKMVK